MALKYPRTSFSAGEPLDHEAFNENLRAFASEMDGRLNEHNWNDSASNGIVVTDIHPSGVLVIKNSGRTLDPGGLGGGSAPTAGVANAYRVPNSAAWEIVSDMSIDVDAGNSLLWIMASLQQQRSPTASTTLDGCQYAIRIDGELIVETISGGTDVNNDPFGESLDGKYSPIVVEAIVPVSPGRKAVQVVARVPKDNAFRVQPVATDFYEIINRELIVVVLDPPGASLAGPSVPWSPVQEGTAVSSASLNTAFSSLSGYVNDLPATAPQAGAFTSAHLPSVVLETKSVRMGPAGVGTKTYTNVYGGYDDDTIGDPGWAIVQDVDSPVNPLSFDFSSSYTLGAGGVRGALVLANIHVISSQSPGTANNSQEEVMAVFAIQAKDSGGTWHTIAKTERYLNDETIATGGGNYEWKVIRKDVAIRTLLTSSDIATLAGVRVVVSVADNTAGATAPTITLQHGNLTAVVLRAGSDNA